MTTGHATHICHALSLNLYNIDEVFNLSAEIFPRIFSQHEFIFSEQDIGTYPIDIELLVDRSKSEDGTRGKLSFLPLWISN